MTGVVLAVACPFCRAAVGKPCKPSAAVAGDRYALAWTHIERTSAAGR